MECRGPAVFLAAAFLVSWQPMECDYYTVDRNDTRIATGSGLQIVDSAIASGQVYAYVVKAWRGAAMSTPDPARRGLYLDFTQGAEQTQMWHAYAGDDSMLVMVYLPPGPWECEASDTLVSCTCEYDYNGDGIVNLSDLFVFGSRGYTLAELAEFGAVYQRFGRMEAQHTQQACAGEGIERVAAAWKDTHGR